MPYKDPEKAKQYNSKYKKKWRKKNIAHALEMERARAKRNREKHCATRKRSYYKHRDEIIARVIKGNRIRYRNRRLRCIEHYGNECACCGQTGIEFLVIDHINGGGLKHRKELRKKSQNIYEFLIKNDYPEEFRVLCHNCNSSYGHYGYCPHQIERGEITKKRANELIEELRIKNNEIKKKSNTKASS